MPDHGGTMDRREFFAAGIGGAIGAGSIDRRELRRRLTPQDDLRALFPRVEREVFLNAAGGTPLGSFAQAGLERYMAFQRLGPGDGRGAYVGEMRSEIRGLFGQLIGARASEISLVHCTKAGEQLVIDGLDPRRHRRNIVTNDMHFAGSLHNLVGLRRSGVDVRIVRATNFDVSLDDMEEAIDDRTALVAVTLVSNVNGRLEPMKELTEVAHRHGALVYADIIQAAGTVPFDVRDMGIDFAACSGYKWLYGVHGVGFLYVREDLQGTALPDRLFPGHARHNYAPWVDRPNSDAEDFVFQQRTDGSRYEPGHVSYLGYCALYEGLKFIHRIGVESALRHSVRLHQRLLQQLGTDEFECISPHVEGSPIVAFTSRNASTLEHRLRAGNVVVALSGNQMRVSAAPYNDEADIDRLVEALS